MKYQQANIFRKISLFLVLFLLAMMTLSIAHAETETYNFVKKWDIPGRNSMYSFSWNGEPIDIDSSGNVYVIDGIHRQIQKFDSNGNLILSFGGHDVSKDFYVGGVSVDSSNNIYLIGHTLLDNLSYPCLQKFDSNGSFISGFDLPQKGYYPNDIDVDSSGNIYVNFFDSLLTLNGDERSDTGVYKFDKNGSLIANWHMDWFSPDGSIYGFSNACSVAVDPYGLFVYVADSGNHKIVKINSLNGNVDARWGYIPGIPVENNGQLFLPMSVDVAPPYVFVADTANNRVQKFDTNGNYITKFGSSMMHPGEGEVQFSSPEGVAVDPSGNVYVIDYGGTRAARIQKFTLKPVANFTSNVTIGPAPLTVKFTNLSKGATEWRWDFGDGNTSTEQNPVHTYYTAGNYTVNLMVSNDYGTDSKSDTINCCSVNTALYIDDAPHNVKVNKAPGDIIDIVEQLDNNETSSVDVDARLQVPSDLFGNPTKVFVRNNFTDTDETNIVAWTEPTSGEYSASITLLPSSKKQVVWRFKIPELSPDTLKLTGSSYVKGSSVSSDSALIKIVWVTEAIIVTNRKTLFEKFGTNGPEKNDVYSLLSYLYEISDANSPGEKSGVVIYADRYDEKVANWDQKVDYTNENTANTVANLVDEIIETRYDKLSHPPYLMIVGGDEIIPFYRADNSKYTSKREHDYKSIDPVKQITSNNYLATDNVYASMNPKYDEGIEDLATGRISSSSARIMKEFIANGILGPTLNSNNVVVFSDRRNDVDIIVNKSSVKKFNLLNLKVYPLSIENNSWTAEDIKNAMNKGFRVFVHGSHGDYNTLQNSTGDKFTTFDIFNIKGISDNRPLITTMGCHSGLITGNSEGAWNPVPFDNNLWAFTSQGSSGMLASTATVIINPNNHADLYIGSGMAYGEQLFNQFFDYLITGSGTTRPVGEALKQAVINYKAGWWTDGKDRRSKIQFVYYGVPWMTFDPPTTTSNSSEPSAIITQLDLPVQISNNTYTRTATIEVSNYTKTQLEGYDLVLIPGAEMIFSDLKPILPKTYINLNLPINSNVKDIKIIQSNQIPIGTLKIPYFKSVSEEDNSTSGFTSETDEIGLYPDPRFIVYTHKLIDHEVVSIGVAPVQFDTQTHNTTLFNKTELEITYEASSPVVITDLTTDKPVFNSGDKVNTNASIENIGSEAFTGMHLELTLKDTTGQVLASTSGSKFDLPIGSSNINTAISTKGLPQGSYVLDVAAFDNTNTPRASFSMFINIYDDFTKPSSITNLQSNSGLTWIKWTWTNPKDSDFNHTEIYLNGIFQTNTSAEFFNATGLQPETRYTLSTRTVDNYGNVNETWVNSTATTSKEFTPEGHLGGITKAIDITGNYAYIGQGQDFMILDISDPSSPIAMSKLTTHDLVKGIKVSGNYAYLAEDNGLVIVDISNTSYPTVAGTYKIDLDPLGVSISGTHIYLTDNHRGLLIFDISNPSYPALAGSYSTGHSNGISVSGNYAYLVGIEGLEIVDISNPSSPTSLGSYHTDMSSKVWGISLSGNYAYLACSDGLLIVDVSNPSYPAVLGKYPTYISAYGVSVSGNYAYLADGEGLSILDISNPTSPSLAGVSGTGGNPTGILVSGNYAYITDISRGLSIFDIRNSNNPTLLKNFNSDGVLWARSVSVSGNYAYLANEGSGLAIFDISNPSHSTLVGSIDNLWTVKSVSVSGSYAYVANYYYGLSIFDISNPSRPTLVGSINTAGGAVDVSVSGNYAYVADENNRLVIIDISNPSSPTLIGSIDTPGTARSVSVSGSYAYVADDLNGLMIIDISKPSSPIIVGSYNTDGNALDISVSGNYAYVADENSGLVILNINNPSSPTFVGMYDTAGTARGVSVTGSYAYIADDLNGLVIVDIGNPSSPSFVGTYDTAGSAMDVSVSGNYAYVADKTNGLIILKTDLKNKVLPVANFSSNVSEGYAPLLVQFKDSSANANSVSWDFGDGNTSSDTDSLHMYSIAGTYTVSLNATNGNGTNSKTKKIIVYQKTSPLLPVANFSTNVTSGYGPLSIQFTDLSENADSISWDFGDGNTSIESDPVYTYFTAGNYTVNLTVSNENGTASKLVTVTVAVYSVTTPQSISNLQSSNGSTWINWTWINPSDSIFNHTEINLNGTFQTNTSAEYFNATNLLPDTNYTLSTRTVDNNGNVNETWVNSTARTVKQVVTIPIFPGCSKPPIDPNNDSLYEDINGNGRLDFADVVTYYNSMAWITQNNLVFYFDYNKNGRIDFNDVVRLYNMH